jgi:hypothetical protein
MTIASQIQDYADGLTASYNMVSQRGGTIPQRKNMDNLSTAIATIPSGGSFVGIPQSVTNGVYGPKKDENFTFTIPSTATEIEQYGLTKKFDSSKVTSFTASGVTTLNQYSLYYAFNNCTYLTSVDLSSLTTVTNQYAMDHAFYGCTSLTSVDLSSLQRIGTSGVNSSNLVNSIFQGCSSLASIDLSSLTEVYYPGLNSAFRNTAIVDLDLSSITTIGGNNTFYYMCYNCPSLKSLDLSGITTISSSSTMGYNMCYNCQNLETIDFSGLTTITSAASQCFYYSFYSCKKLTRVEFPSLTTVEASGAFQSAFGSCGQNTLSVYFPALTSLGTNDNQFKTMFQFTTGATVHFPAAMQATIEAMQGYPNFGGTNTTVLFDL